VNTCEYLARVGFAAILAEIGGPTATCFDDEEPGDGVVRESDAPAVAHRRVRERILAADKPEPRSGTAVGAKWLGRVVTWPDRVPGLKAWAAKATLAGIIAGHVKRLAADEGRTADLFAVRGVIRTKAGEGPSGLDSTTCQNAIDVGFSPSNLGVDIVCRPALELLAVVGLESVPLVSFAARVCGFVHAGKVWRFAVEDRDGGYFKRWGDCSPAE
jgi:hypothetical protein